MDLYKAAFLLGLSACAQPIHLGYDYGRSYASAFDAQADLTRPAVATMQHRLYGKEAESIRLKVTTETGGGGGGE